VGKEIFKSPVGIRLSAPNVNGVPIITIYKNMTKIIKVYSTPTCPYCSSLKDYLKAKGFEFEDLDVASDDKAREEMINLTGKMSVPVVTIDGNVVTEFDVKKINELLGI
jgi:glutaredoxin-like YruB-family protein